MPYLWGIVAVVSMSLSAPAAAINLPSGFTEQVAIGSGLNGPVGMAFLPDGRLLVIQQGNNTNGNADDDAKVKLWADATLSTLLTMSEVNTGGERGLLGIAVDPAFPSRPYIYVFYTNNSPQKIHIARYTVGGGLNDPSSADLTIDSNTKVILLHDIPDDASNHNGGTLRFGPDGKLYVSVGDDADRCDAQDRTLLKGKILRINVDGVTGAFDAGSDRASLDPGDNPFSGDVNLDKRLIWAYGLRNPFRFSIDPVSGRTYVGDVGHNTREETSEGSPPANEGGSSNADNFAWPYYEGTHVPANPNCGITPPPNHPPIFEYDHGGRGSLSVIASNVCAGEDAGFDVVVSDDQQCAAASSVAVKGTARVMATGSLGVIPPQINVESGFKVESNGGFSTHSANPCPACP